VARPSTFGAGYSRQGFAGDRWQENLREVIAAVSAERRAKIVVAYRQKLIAVKKKRQLKEAKRASWSLITN